MNQVETAGGAGAIEIGPPKRFTPWAVFVCCAYGLLLLLPALVCMLALSLRGLDLFTVAVPLCLLAGSTFFLPFGFGNPHVAKLAQPFRPNDGGQGEPFLVQLALVPRLRTGLRAVIEDADDFGWLSFTESALLFRGDSVNLSLPLAQVTSVRRETSGLRALFPYSRIALEVSGLGDIRTLRFAERSSFLLLSSRRTTLRLYQSALARVSGKP